MFSTFFRFELRYWLRGMMLYVFLGIMSLLIFGAASADNIQVGLNLTNVNRNAPFVVQVFYMATSTLSCLMVTAFVNAAACRDFAHNTHQLIFTKPMSKFGYLMGRFWGSVLIAVIPMLGASIGVIAAQFMPWADARKWGPIDWTAHLNGIICFAIPNAIFIGCIVFAIASWTRSALASFVGVMGLIVGLSIAGMLAGNMENKTLLTFVDPFGESAFGVATEYWTVAEKNSQSMSLTGPLLVNRILWMSIGAIIMAITCWRFSFSAESGGLRRWAHSALREIRSIDVDVPVVGTAVRLGIWLLTLPFAMLFSYRHETADDDSIQTAVDVPNVDTRRGIGAAVAQLISQIRVDLMSIVTSPVFLLVMGFGIFATFMNLTMSSSEGFGLASKPVTYNEISVIRGSLYVYLIVCITFFSGVVVWKERDAKLDEVYDALPHPTWIAFVGKLVSIMLVVLAVVFAGMMCGMVHQLSKGYTRFQVPLYLTELFVLDIPQLFCFVVLAMLAHIVAPNKYVGYFGFIIFVIVNRFVWAGLDVDTILVRYGQLPDYTYSDLFLFAPFSSALGWIGSYWILFALFLCCAAIMLWVRGRERGFRNRLRMMLPRWTGLLRVASVLLFVLWASCGAWAFYNTKVLNEYTTDDQETLMQVRYEKDHKADEKQLQPRVTQVTYHIDIFPKKRGLLMKGEQTIVNQHDEPIETIFIVESNDFETTVEIEGASVVDEDEDLKYFTYKVDPPMQPGEERAMKFTVQYESVGFENEISIPQIVQNGTFFNSSIAPQIGYQPGLELTDRDDREENGLGEPTIALPLNPDNIKGRSNTYISNNSDWVDIETFISTSSDQIAIAPGSLQRQWKDGDRNHFHYKMDHPSLNFYSFISADYEVERTAWNDVDIEVYYHKEHHWNVPKMVNSIKKSLAYYTENFGPYKHKQARIIEFPRIASFAQAFPGTMPYSEGIGFIADIQDVDDIDMVFYVVAHEMAHQWWAHQVIGANMRGATLLSETMAQYSALMVMEHEYGRDMMRKFLAYEMDNYLKSRGSEQLDERPLMEVEPNQGYVHYRKGSVVMYHLKELIGEDKVNAALRSVVEKFGYQGPPYPTSVDLLDAFREQMSPEQHHVLTDLFEEITLFGNRTSEATYRKLESGGYEVTIGVECHKYQANSRGLETEIDIDDWIEIGAFAKPPSSRKYGETLHRELVHITKPQHTFTFKVDQLPHRAGVDPFSLLIDRDPDNNMKPVKLAD